MVLKPETHREATKLRFENDVKMYGTQAKRYISMSTNCLRMM